MLASGRDFKVPYEEAKAELSQVLLKYSAELDSLECPFVWDLLGYFDTVDFEMYARSHSGGDDDEIDPDRFDWIFTRIAKQYFGLGVTRSLTSLASLIKDVKARAQPIHGSIEYTNAILYIAQSCGVVLYLLNGDETTAEILKGSMNRLESTVEIGHVKGIQGMIYLNLDDAKSLDAGPFIDAAIPATNRHFEYLYAKSKLLTRVRKFNNEKKVSAEEIELLAEVADEHPFAVPHLLTSLNTAIRCSEANGDSDPGLRRQWATVLGQAWNNRHQYNFGVPGLSSLALQFKFAEEYDKAKEIFEMALTKEPTKVNETLMHHYGRFLIENKGYLETGFGYLAKAGHPTAFADLVYLLDQNLYFKREVPIAKHLDQFISGNKKVSYKRLFSYIAYRHYLIQREVTLSVDYLKKAIMFDTGNLTFVFKRHFKMNAYKNIQALIGHNPLPEVVDLSHDVAFMSDSSKKFNDDTQSPKPVNELTSWWETSGLKPVGEYAGYQAYQQGQRRQNDRTRSTSSDNERPTWSYNSRDQERYHNSSTRASSDSPNWRRDCPNRE